MKLKTLYNKTNNGLFGAIASILNASWFDDTKAKTLNTYYFLGHSGNKTLSPFMSNIIDENGVIDDNERLVVKEYDIEVLSDDSLTNTNNLLASIIVDTYGSKWIDLYEALTLKYDLERIDETTKIETPNIQNTKETTNNGANKVTKNETETSYQGFNSTSYSPRDKVSNTYESSDSERNIATETQKGSISTTESKKGGDVSSKIAKYIALRNTLINDVIIHDIDKLLASPYYEY